MIKKICPYGLDSRFLEVLERKFLSERSYKLGHGMKEKDGMSMCQEITIAKINIEKLVRLCLD